MRSAPTSASSRMRSPDTRLAKARLLKAARGLSLARVIERHPKALVVASAIAGVGFGMRPMHDQVSTIRRSLGKAARLVPWSIPVITAVRQGIQLGLAASENGRHEN